MLPTRIMYKWIHTGTGWEEATGEAGSRGGKAPWHPLTKRGGIRRPCGEGMAEETGPEHLKTVTLSTKLGDSRRGISKPADGLEHIVQEEGAAITLSTKRAVSGRRGCADKSRQGLMYCHHQASGLLNLFTKCRIKMIFQRRRSSSYTTHWLCWGFSTNVTQRSIQTPDHLCDGAGRHPLWISVSSVNDRRQWWYQFAEPLRE